MGSILIVDNSEFWRNEISIPLENNGYDIFYAINSKDAIQKITNPKYSIDLIWLNIMIDSEDVSFQRMIEFEQLLKKIDQKIPIIIYSGLDLNFKVRKPEYIYYEKDHCKIKDFIDKHRTNWKHLIKHQVDNKEFPNIVENMIGHDNLQHKYDMSIKTKTILFLGANPIDTIHLRLGEEVREITENLRLSKERDSLIFKQEWAVTTDSLMQAILDENPYILHFSGHGETEGICLEYSDKTAHIINTEIICSFFKLFNKVKCVLLNCCYSKSQAESIIKYIPYVVGMPSCIKDEASIAFSVGFYKALGAGRDIPFAYDLGKWNMQTKGYTNDAILPVLLVKNGNILS